MQRAQLGLKALEGQAEITDRGRRLTEEERANRAGEGLSWYRARTEREKAQREGAAGEQEIRRLAKDMGGEVAQGAQKLMEIDEALRAQGVRGIDDTETSVDLSGVGPFTNLTTRIAGNTFISQAGSDLRNPVLGLAATIKYLRTGKTATSQEANEIAQEFGLAPGSSEMDLRRGIQRMREEFIARARQKGAGYSPSTVEMFESRGGTTAKALGEIGQGPGRGRISRTVNGETRYWNGTAWVR